VSKIAEGDIATILKKSSNIGAAKIAFLLGAKRLEDAMRAFGFGSTTTSGFPGEARGLLRPSELWVPVELANVSFGQGMAATGIQLAMALAALANEGRLMRPLLVSRVLDGRGQVMTTFQPEVVRQVISPETARTVLDLMQSVVEPDGTGKRAYIPEYPVAGKTGTGQKPHLRRRGYSADMWVNTFFGVAPVNDPELAIVILIDEPQSKQHGGGLIAAPAFRAIMQQSLEYLGVPSPYTSTRRHIWLEPQTLAERRALEHADEEAADDALAALLPPVAAATDGTLPVPDFKGLTMREVRHLAARIGLRVRYVGTGLATAQDALPNDRVVSEREVTVTFSSRLPTAPTPEISQAPTLPPEAGAPGFDPTFDPSIGAVVVPGPNPGVAPAVAPPLAPPLVPAGPAAPFIGPPLPEGGTP
jgi:cell division protein FtsI (penicillin-binding protein 3)